MKRTKSGIPFRKKEEGDFHYKEGNESIVVLGSCNIDMIALCEKVPAVGETVLAKKLEKHFGGKGANQAVQCALLGGRVSFIGCVGSDSFGEDYLLQFKELGIETNFLKVLKQGEGKVEEESVSTGLAMISVSSEDGKNSIVVIPGANDKLTAQDVQNAEQIFTENGFFVTQLENPFPTVLFGLQMAKKHKMKTVFNPSPISSSFFSSLPLNFFSLIDFLVVNEIEAQILSAENVVDFHTAEKAANILHKKGCSHVLITLGEKGEPKLFKSLLF